MANSIIADGKLSFSLGPNFFGAADETAARALQYFQSIEQDVYDAVYLRMRDDTGAERENLKSFTIGGDAPALVVYGDLVQTWVDEFGLEPGTFPPFRPDSNLWNWVAKHFDVSLPDRPYNGSLSLEQRQENQITGLTFALAKLIHDRGLPSPNDYLHRPFGNAFEEFAPTVSENLLDLGFVVSNWVNGEGE